MTFVFRGPVKAYYSGKNNVKLRDVEYTAYNFFKQLCLQICDLHSCDHKSSSIDQP